MTPPPTAPAPLIQMALRDLQNGEVAAAEAKCLRAIEADREGPAGWTVLGMILQAKGRHDDAVRVFHSLTLKYPGDAEHWSNLGVAFRGAKRYDQALAAFQRALPLSTPSAQILYNIGLVHVERLDYPSAYTVLSQAAAMAPTNAWIRRAFAQCCCDLGNFDEALAALARWPDLEGLTAENVAEIAYLLITMGERRGAERALDWLGAHPPGGGRPALTLANAYERLNRLADARAMMARVKTGGGIPPDDPDVLLADALLAQRDGQHGEARELLSRALAARDDFPRRHNLLFPLARSLDAQGDHDGAFAALTEAHASQLAYFAAAFGRTPADESPTLALTRHGVDRQDLARWNHLHAPPAAESPVFIVGFPRSGTTLLELTLDAHAGLASMDEQSFLRQAVDEVRLLGIDYPAALGELDEAQLQRIRAHYWENVARRVTLRPGQRLVDKNPLNLLRLPMIHRLFPHARTILLVRHPCDTLLSCFSQHFRATDLAMACRDLPTLAQHYRRAFDYWYAESALLKSPVYELRYETLVADFSGEVRRLAEFLELPWDARMLAPADHALAKGFISTPSYTQVVEPVSSKGVGRWQGYRQYFREVLPLLAPDLDRWGYSPADDGAP